jgi:hypothetical protein
MPILNINTTNHADFVPEILLNEAIRRLRNKLVLVPKIAKNSDLNGIEAKGNIVNIDKLGTLVATQRTETGAIVLQQPTPSKVHVHLDQFWNVAFSVSDFMKVFSPINTEPGYIDDGIGVLAEKVESSVFDLYASMTHQVGAAGVVADESLILDAMAEMDDNNAPSDGRNLVISSKDYKALRLVDRLTSAEKIGDAAIRTSSLGMLHDFEVQRSNLVATSGAAPGNTHNIAFTKFGMVLVSRALEPVRGAISTQIQDPVSGLIFRLVIGYNSEYNCDQVVLECLWGTAIMQQELCVDVLT